MDNDYIYDNLQALIKASGMHRLIICSELKISLACLDDFINKRLRPSDEMFNKFRDIFKQ